MTQPRFAPIAIEDEVRPIASLEPPRAWTSHRPGDFRAGERTSGSLATRRRREGAPGPDQGYALRLAEHAAQSIALAPGEHREDALAAAVAIALRRAARLGRAPVAKDITYGLSVLGFTGELPPEHAAARRALIAGAAHDYWRQRAIADLVPEDHLLEEPAAVASAALSWAGAGTPSS